MLLLGHETLVVELFTQDSSQILFLFLLLLIIDSVMAYSLRKGVKVVDMQYIATGLSHLIHVLVINKPQYAWESLNSL